MVKDCYCTLKCAAQSEFIEKKSRFIGWAHPVIMEDEIKALLDSYRKHYASANHICYGYILGIEREHVRVSDDGEPGGTAGRPILGQINAAQLTNVLIVVIRYFGGVKLGTGGLISAYQRAANEAIKSAGIISLEKKSFVSFQFAYTETNAVQSLLKRYGCNVVTEAYAQSCRMKIAVPVRHHIEVMNSLKNIVSVVINH